MYGSSWTSRSRSRTPEQPSWLYVVGRIDPGRAMRLHPWESSARDRGTAGFGGNVVVDRATGGKVQADAGLGQGRLIRLNDDGRYVVLDAQGGTYVRDLRTGRLVRAADTPAVAASRDARHLLLSGADGLRLLDRRTGRSPAVGPAGAQAVPGAVSADGRAAVFGSAAADLVAGDTNDAADVFVRRPR